MPASPVASCAESAKVGPWSSYSLSPHHAYPSILDRLLNTQYSIGTSLLPECTRLVAQTYMVFLQGREILEAGSEKSNSVGVYVNRSFTPCLGTNFTGSLQSRQDPTGTNRWKQPRPQLQHYRRSTTINVDSVSRSSLERSVLICRPPCTTQLKTQVRIPGSRYVTCLDNK